MSYIIGPNHYIGGKGPPYTRPAIVDENGMTYSDWEYVDIGVNEGWLMLIGWHREGRFMIYRYRHIG